MRFFLSFVIIFLPACMELLLSELRCQSDVWTSNMTLDLTNDGVSKTSILKAVQASEMVSKTMGLLALIRVRSGETSFRFELRHGDCGKILDGMTVQK